MGEYIEIGHIDQLLAMPNSRQQEFRWEVKQYLDEHPIKHMETEWGRFEDLPPMSEEEIEDMAIEIIDEMTLEQKVYQMSSDLTPGIVQFTPDRYNSIPYYAGEDFEHNIPAIRFADGPSGVVLGYHSTAFPVSMARAATFDPDLERRVGDVIGVEARSGGANFFAGVCVNLLRHPGWGRAQETYGEDPYLLGTMGCALIEGVQRHVMACVKHFAANSIENSRFIVSVECDERTLREMYLPHFKACVKAGVAAVMSAYNRVRGQWCGHSKYLLTDILKEEWGFDGFVMSDFLFGIRGTVEPANAGLDLEMNATQFYGERLVKAVRDGFVSEDRINDSVGRILRQKIRFSHVGEKSRYKSEMMGCAQHATLALEVAQKSMVLLKNRDRTLPLDRHKINKILVAGDLAILGAIGDTKGSSAVYPPYVVTAFDGIQKAAGEGIEVRFLRGVCEDAVRQIGCDYDAVIVYVGLTHLNEGEYFPSSADSAIGGDRLDLSLSGKEIGLINAAAEGNANTIVVLQGGSAIQVEPWKDNVSAIIMQWYSGMEGGTALGQILFGEINPSGKLPVTIHSSQQQLPYFGLNLQSINYDMYHGYFAADKYRQRVTYPFGYGLSYTSFLYASPRLSSNLVEQYGNIVVYIDVTNVGNMSGEEIVQCYIGYKNSSVARHIKDLKGFTRLSLKPNETKTAAITVSMRNLAYYCEDLKKWITEDIIYTAYIGSSSKEEDLHKLDFRIDFTL